MVDIFHFYCVVWSTFLIKFEGYTARKWHIPLHSIYFFTHKLSLMHKSLLMAHVSTCTYIHGRQQKVFENLEYVAINKKVPRARKSLNLLNSETTLRNADEVSSWGENGSNSTFRPNKKRQRAMYRFFARLTLLSTHGRRVSRGKWRVLAITTEI